jgi:hypothetical protein
MQAHTNPSRGALAICMELSFGQRLSKEEYSIDHILTTNNM